MLRVYGPRIWSRYIIDGKVINLFGEKHYPVNIPNEDSYYDFSRFLEYVCMKGTQFDIFIESKFATDDLDAPKIKILTEFFQVHRS